jgi:aminopeptidase N
MTLQALRNEVGDDAFSTILREWAASQAGDTATTEEFIALAEGVSGQELDDLFTAWLYTAGRPADLPAPVPAPAA